MQTSDGPAPAGTMVEEVETESARQSMALVAQPNTFGERVLGTAEAARSEETSGLSAAIRRLEDIVDEETAALETRQQIDFEEFSLRKSRSMLEFARLTRPTHLKDNGEVANNLQRLRLKLERNRALLQMHLEAACEVAAIIARAIRESESDGTYSADMSR
jgi:hypothetical protein